MLAIKRWVRRVLGPMALLCASALHAQWQASTGPAGASLGAVVGGDVERYVRALAVAGIVAPIPWAIRPFGPDDLSKFLRDSVARTHPWQPALKAAIAPHAAIGGVALASYNSGFPWGSNDGALWQGRGATGATGVAAVLRWRFLSAVAAPIAFSAQNASYRLQDQPLTNISPLADPLLARGIDLPQRMGTSDYSRVNGGESSLRLSYQSLTLGISTASLGWGTGEAFPAIFGANGGGFPHIFFGTRGRGINFPTLARFNLRYVLGVLDQSPWSPVRGSETFIDASQPGTRRIGTGFTASVLPAFLPGLELGASRFYHSPYLAPADRWDAWSKPFEGIFKRSFVNRAGNPGDANGDADNQLASLFARWTFPSRGAEATFELFREDHSWDSRDQALEPENNGAVMASIRAITERRADRLSMLTLEYFDGDIRPIAQARAQGALYVHSVLTQGHTQRGQLLGTPIGGGAIAGQRVAWERFTESGSIRANLQRWRNRALRPTNVESLYPAADRAVGSTHDWIIDGSVGLTRYRRARALSSELGVAWAGQWQLNSSRVNFYARTSWSIF
jgi:hypothetical protein